MQSETCPENRVEVRLNCAERINFAFQQNAIPVLRRVEIRNHGGQPLHDVICQFRPKPGWALDHGESIERIEAHSDYTLRDIPLHLSLKYLSQLSERVRGELAVRVIGKIGDATEQTLLWETVVAIDVYAYDEWTGLHGLPELIAAFITPNTAYVDSLLSSGADLLAARTQNSALDGYQAKSKRRVYQILECLFMAVQAQGIRYANPPASFENTGQRIRFAARIEETGLATCLDLALLFCGLIEAAGLRPILLLHQGHAYAGCWLIEETFQDPSCDDLQSIRKRVELEEVLVFECTHACEGQGQDLLAACEAARAHLHKDAIFENAIGVHRARMAGIRPLPIARGSSHIDSEAAKTRGEKALAQLPVERREKSFREAEEAAYTQTPQGRIEHWKQQLLDLTLRNRLLNFKENKRTLQILCPDAEHMENELAAQRRLAILGASKAMAEVDPRSPQLQALQSLDDPLHAHLMEELRANRLRSPLPEKELNDRLLELYRRSRAEMEESGANSLYLAIGFLEWTEVAGSDQVHKAPLLLVPVKMDRKSVRHGFSLQRMDEDAIVNVTLLELLRRDFQLEVPGVNPPPEDEAGIDVGAVLLRFQQAVKDLKGWEVRKEVWMGQFSFNKFLLWTDLNARVEGLMQNAVVEHLVNRPGEPFEDAVESIAPEALDEAVPYHEIYCPLSADSSQLAAVVAAARGKNYVMHGPPGTGKSQTITNLIAHCLAMGKRVLFVAEKRAALEVVHKRLSAIGLGPFCLELHSNKAGKAEVLRQIGEAMDFAAAESSAQWAYTATQLETARKALNDYVRALHTPMENGLSAYHCQTWLMTHSALREALAALPPLDIDDIEWHTRAHYDALCKVCEDLTLRGNERRIPRAAMQALRPFEFTDLVPEQEAELIEAANTLIESVETFAAAMAAPCGQFGLAENAAESRATIEGKLRLMALCKNAPSLPSVFVTASGWRAFRAAAAQWCETGLRLHALRKKVAAHDWAQLSALDLAAMQRQLAPLLAGNGVVNALQRWWALRPLRKTRKAGGAALQHSEVAALLADAMAIQSAEAELTAAGQSATERFGSHWLGLDSDWQKLQRLLAFGDALQSHIAELAGTDFAYLGALRTKLGSLLEMAEDALADGKPVELQITDAETAYGRLCVAEERLSEAAVVNRAIPLAEPGHLAQLRELSERLIAQRPHLQVWAYWQDAYQQAIAGGLRPLLDACEQGTLALAQLPDAFAVRYREHVLDNLVSRNESLRHFWGEEQAMRIENFCRLDTEYTDLTAREVVARLAAGLPQTRHGAAPRNSELGILNRERAKRARHMPVRKLLSAAPQLLAQLKPCFLMSPLSVAQYLDASQDNFDLVVFDEASQIPVWDAVGAIGRGRQVIVVGDPKQLPPTNFFGRTESDEAAMDEGTIEDLESILDECLGSGLAVAHLKWHYRSRKEGLIAFSNHHYYENRLNTFPSPDAEEPGVRLIPVPDGFYDKGRTRTNLAEAEAIVAEVVRRLKDPQLAQQSIGIVTFSQAQQTLVLDKLDVARSEHPEIEPYFGEQVEEPVFVKNLENVQGDERDVIIFSVCYGPDATGKVSMNFGPLNRSGGERRLNVAVTRAKSAVLIYATLRSEQIDLTRTRALGSEHLKAYLEYAERGPRSLVGWVSDADEAAQAAAFEAEVAAFLNQAGYKTDTQVGCSGYRIDIAVRQPDAPGRYVIGLTCDGASYQRAATARDRDRLRKAVLEGLGWHIHQVWSTDWFRNRAQAEQDLLATVAQAIAQTSTAPRSVGDEPNTAD